MDGSSISGPAGNPGAAESPPLRSGQEAAKSQPSVPADSKPDAPAVIGLKHGQQLRATVLEILANQEVVLGVFGTTTTVRSRLQLQVGQELMLEVIMQGDQIQLKAKGGAENVLEMLPLPELFKMEKGLQSLEQGFKKLMASQLAKLFPVAETDASGRPTLPSPEGIKVFHEQLGLNFERRLLELPKLEPDARRSEVKSLRQTLRSLGAVTGKAEATAGASLKSGTLDDNSALAEVLKQAEQWRGEQAARSEAGLPLVYPLPDLPGMRDGRLYLLLEDGTAQEQRKSADEHAKNYTLMFLLELESLGSLRIDASMNGADVCLRFHCLRESSVPRIHQGLDSLRTAFEEVGLRLVNSSVKWSRQNLPVLDLLPPSSSGKALFDMEL